VLFSSGDARRGMAAPYVAAIGITLFSAALWVAASYSLSYAIRVAASDSLSYSTRLDIAASPALQTAFLRAHPGQFLEICARTFQGSLVEYSRQIVGVLS
jgi:hypothetical protein